MNPFTEHTKQQGVTYLEHWFFAMGIAWRLFNSVTAFVVHALFPFIDIERRLDLEATSAFLLERNDWIENAGERKNNYTIPQLPAHSPSASENRPVRPA